MDLTGDEDSFAPGSDEGAALAAALVFARCFFSEGIFPEEALEDMFNKSATHKTMSGD